MKTELITAEIVTDSQATQADLAQRARVINDKISVIMGHESAFEEATLEHRLVIGLELAHAKAAFGMKIPNPSGSNQHTKEVMSPGDATSPNALGFAAWLGREVPDFNRSKADLYINAFQSLGLSRHEATPKLIREKLKKLTYQADKNGERRPTLKSLYKLGKPAPSKEPLKIEGPKDTAEIRLQDAREAWGLWREQAETMIKRGILDDLDKPGLEEMKEFQAWLRDRINARLKSF